MSFHKLRTPHRATIRTTPYCRAHHRLHTTLRLPWPLPRSTICSWPQCYAGERNRWKPNPRQMHRSNSWSRAAVSHLFLPGEALLRLLRTKREGGRGIFENRQETTINRDQCAHSQWPQLHLQVLEADTAATREGLDSFPWTIMGRD